LVDIQNIEDITILVFGHSSSQSIASCILVDMLIFLSLHDTGFLDLMGLRGWAFAKARTLIRVLSDTFS
jgi:hypothetical protein